MAGCLGKLQAPTYTPYLLCLVFAVLLFLYLYISCPAETLGDKLTAKQLCPSSVCDLHDLHRDRLKSFPDLLTPRFTSDLGLSSPSTVGKQTVVSQGLAYRRLKLTEGKADRPSHWTTKPMEAYRRI